LIMMVMATCTAHLAADTRREDTRRADMRAADMRGADTGAAAAIAEYQSHYLHS
jgi:hypothetical protein